jgi:deazaflavin-dependent oxidoreductase (nitroreductase family)
MFRRSFQSLEKRFFRTLNTYLEPLISTGLGSPGLTPVGAVVLETTGRKSGRTYKTPVLASEFATLLLVSTVRSRSQWIKNLAATPQTKVWLRGQSVPVTAYVIGRGQSVPVTAYVIGPRLSRSEGIPAPSPIVQFLINRLRRWSKLTGADFAILDRHAPQVSGG